MLRTGITIWSWILIMSGPYYGINNTGTTGVRAQFQQQGQGQPNSPSSVRPPYCDCQSIANPTSDLGQSSFLETSSGYCTNTGETLTDLCDVANKLYSSQNMGLRPCGSDTNGTPTDETQTDEPSPDTSDPSDASVGPTRRKRQTAVSQVTQACLTNGSSVSLDMAALMQIIANNTALGMRCLSRCPCDIHCPITGDTETGYPSSSGRTSSPNVNNQSETYTLPPGDAPGGSYDPDQPSVDGISDQSQQNPGSGNGGSFSGGGQFGGQNNGQPENFNSGVNGNGFPINSNNGNPNSFNPNSNGYQANRNPSNNGNQNGFNPYSNSNGYSTSGNNNWNQNSQSPYPNSNGYQTNPSNNGNQNFDNPYSNNNGYPTSSNNNGNQNSMNPYSNNNTPQPNTNYDGIGQNNMAPSQYTGSQSGYQNNGNQGLPVWDINGNNWNVGQGASQQSNRDQLNANSGNTGNYGFGRYGTNSYQNSNRYQSGQASQQMYATHGQNSYWTSDGRRTGSHGYGRFQAY